MAIYIKNKVRGFWTYFGLWVLFTSYLKICGKMEFVCVCFWTDQYVIAMARINGHFNDHRLEMIRLFFVWIIHIIIIWIFDKGFTWQFSLKYVKRYLLGSFPSLLMQKISFDVVGLFSLLYELASCHMVQSICILTRDNDKAMRQQFKVCILTWKLEKLSFSRCCIL